MSKPTLNLTRGAAHRLAILSATGGLLTDPSTLYRVGEFAENHLADLPSPPKSPEQTAKQDEIAAWNDAFKAWAKQTLEPIELTERKRDALKALVKAAAEKGVLSGSIVDTALLRALGMQPED